MSWNEQEMRDRKPMAVSPERAALLNKVKSESLPVIKQEAASGDRTFEPVQFQPVRSPGNFEAEFGVKGDDLIFHFWPWGFHEAERAGKPRPAFPPGFGETLAQTLVDTLDGRTINVEEVRDMGSWFACAAGYAKKQFWRDLAIKVVTALHKEMGGK